LQHSSFTSETLNEAYRPSEFQAFSVTAPLKLQALEAADDASSTAQSIGAANFLLRQNGRWVAHNTDGAGALDPLQEAGLEPGRPIMVLGAGGAARAAVFEAITRGFPVIVAARRLEAAQKLVEEMDLATEKVPNRVSIEGLDLSNPRLFDDLIDPTDPCPDNFPRFGVIQATPVGGIRHPGNPLGSQPFPPGGIALDMVYDPPETEFLSSVRLSGSKSLGGHHMLLAQMCKQFSLGVGSSPPKKLLQLALEKDLGLPCQPILLIGPRASGKSTLGKMLADFLGFHFLDADLELEALHQRRLSEWVQLDEPSFRLAEADLLKKLLKASDTVVALGGGVVEMPESVELLERHPSVFALEISPKEQLARRTAGDRPSLTNLSLPEEVHSLHRWREPLYQKACSGRKINVGGIMPTSFLSMLHSINLIG
jgi:shikimate dehydrogenase